MRIRYGPTLCILLAFAACVGAADAPIRLPVAPVVPSPMPPAPSPDAALRLAGDQFFYVDSDVPVLVIASPKGIVSISEPEDGSAGKYKIKGRFIDSPNDRNETRMFKGKAVYTIEAIGKGRVEILVIPQGTIDGALVTRRVLDVDVDAETGRKPCPEPKPVPPTPDPKPVPPDAFTAEVIAAYAAETGGEKQGNVLSLASLYRTAAVTTVKDPGVKTYGDLFRDLEAASPALLPKTAIPGVRKVIGARLNASLKPTELTPINRDLTAKEFAAVAAALEAAAK